VSGFKNNSEKSLSDLIDWLYELAVETPPTSDADRANFAVEVADVARALQKRRDELGYTLGMRSLGRTQVSV